MLDKKSKLKSLTDHLENFINTSEDKSTIDKPLIEKEIKKFHRPARESKSPKEESFLDVVERYLSTHKLSESRCKNFKVIIRSLQRFELFKKKEGTEGSNYRLQPYQLIYYTRSRIFLVMKKRRF